MASVPVVVAAVPRPWVARQEPPASEVSACGKQQSPADSANGSRLANNVATGAEEAASSYTNADTPTHRFRCTK